MSLNEYKAYEFQSSKQDYWKQRSKSETVDRRSPLLKSINIGGEAFDKIFGTSTINIVPQGSAELIFGLNTSKINNPNISERLRKTTTFDFQEKIQMNVTGSIGDKMKLGVNYNTEATFDFENKTKLEYNGKEDEIIKKIEAGNVSLPLTGSLITGSQSLFGLKTEMQFGKLYMTTVISQQKGESSVIEVKGGAQQEEFELPIDQYDANKHFFLAQYFRNNYESGLKSLPTINSGVTITKIEVYVTNKSSNYENTRNIVAFMDLGENIVHNTIPEFQPANGNITLPYNERNGLYNAVINNYSAREINVVSNRLGSLSGFYLGQDFEKVENARRLTEREYTLNEKLGYISLNTALNSDEVLAVAFEYNYMGKTYRVGELSTSGVTAPQALVLKLIKPTNLTPKLPIWDLMMKNVYAIGAYQVTKEDFELHVLYQDDKTGNAINYIPEKETKGEILIRALKMDTLNSQNDPIPDGVFDYVPGITINESNGRIFFTTLEPFGRTLDNYLAGKNVAPSVRQKYTFNVLYDSTQTKARLEAERNKFKIRGRYQSSSSSEISLNAPNVPQGSVVVTAGGMKLAENIDYTVDYMLGRVKIINQGLLESGTPIKISLESNSLFNIQTKTLLGTHLDYKINDNFIIGGTVLHLSERPLTQKVNIGDEPISNTIWGLNGTYTAKSQLLTTLIDKLPLIQTKEPSSFTFEGEFAHLIPGHSKHITKSGAAYIDDFEGSETSYEMKSYPAWSLASTPQGQNDLFREASTTNDLKYGHNRAKLAWYVIDPLFLRNTSATPRHIKNNKIAKSSPFVREVQEKEIFKNVSNPSNLPSTLQILNVAYYPKERGPYNYDLNLDQNGKLLRPEERWGGMMREVLTNDFEAANVQFIEFWVMDPYVSDSVSNNHGKLYFNLGNVSEDVLKDGRKSFENGFPKNELVQNVDSTKWGRVPDITSQSLTNAFDNDPASRKFQDIGLDGLSDTDEKKFFTGFLDSVKNRVTDQVALDQILNDPSNDNFHYYRGDDYDDQELGILERYKRYNGYEGNSPALEANTDATASGTSLPNSEDINRDNTLSENESYYQYAVDISRDALKEVGKNYITDIVSYDIPEETEAGQKTTTVRWLQFRIPISEPEKVVGSIQDFKSIRFMRMFLKGFEDSVILRFAKLELVRGEWRKYNLSMRQGGEGVSIPEESDGTFEIASVNIEENSTKKPVNYVLPPGIDRVIDPQNPQLTQLNEQSMVLKVQDLVNGDARAAYKTINLDIRQYKRLQMEVHAERIPGTELNDNEMTVFIRMGSDYRNNYYEIEVPLKLTPHKSDYVDEDDDDRRAVWPEENRIDFAFEDLQRLKQARNDMMRGSNSNITYTTVFPYTIDGRPYKYYICGNPNLSNIRTMMIGVRYPKKPDAEGQTRSAEVWVNELRLTNFNEKGGWAANARMITKLADLGTVSIAGSTLKPGFGSIDQKVNERSKVEINSYDISSNLELGKFFPEKSGVQLPMYVGFSESFTDPEYNPTDPDIPLQAALDNARNKAERDSIIKISRDYTRRRSLNFTNVRINKMDGKPHFYDIANWSLNYAFNETYSFNINTQRYIDKRYHGSIMYNYTARPKTIQPFQKVKILNNRFLRLVKDFNFNLGPTTLGFNTEISRYYREMLNRDINNYGGTVIPTVSKDFLWNRNYEFSYDLTRSIRIDFTASNIARIDEPTSINVVNRYHKEEYDLWKEYVWREIMSMGRTTQYFHDINVSYNLPLNKFPWLDWTSSNVRYTASYGWDVAPQNEYNIGNTIKNSNTFQISGQMNMSTLYNKVPYFKRLLQPVNRKQEQKKKTKKVIYERSSMVLTAGEPKIVFHKLSTDEVVVKFFDKDNKEVKGKTTIVNENKIEFTPDSSMNNARVLVEGTVEVNPSPFVLILENTTRILLGIKNISLTYSQTQGSILPGYNRNTKILGMVSDGDMYAPGLPFILGYQDRDFARKAATEYGWVTTSPYQNSPFIMTHNETFQGRIVFEPYQGFKIELNGLRTYSRNESSYWIADSLTHAFPDDTRGYTRNGNFSMTIISLGSAFERLTSKNYEYSPAFEKFKENRYRIISRLAQERHNLDNGYDPKLVDGVADGYNENAQQVLISAFLAAYGGTSPQNVKLKSIPSFWDMRPNWTITFDGLSRLEFVKKYARSVNLRHTYKSTYNIGNYLSNSDFFRDADIETGLSNLRDLQNNFLGPIEINSVSIREDFSPLVNVDVAWKNSLSTRFELRRNRNVNLSLSSYQVTETSNNDIIIGTGYKFKDVQFIIKSGDGQKSFKSDLNLAADVSIRDNKVIIRKLEGAPQAAQGQNVVTVKFSADYNLSESFNLRFFYDRIVNKPFTSISYPTANTNIGFSVRFTLVQ